MNKIRGKKRTSEDYLKAKQLAYETQEIYRDPGRKTSETTEKV